MEFGAILEAGDCAKPLLWYVLSPDGECPSGRVGQACVALANEDGKKTQAVYVFGGANPREIFTDTYRLNLGKSFQWEKLNVTGFEGRYEHACSVDSQTGDIFTFGGANLANSLQHLQILKRGSSEWVAIVTEVEIPCARTCHNNATMGSDIVVFSGGMTGPNPVDDLDVHIFDTALRQWRQPSLKGDGPSARQGHAMCVMGTSIFVHGGISGTTIYDDCYVLDTKTMTWAKQETIGCIPPGRASHGIAASRNLIFIFGGLGMQGALDDLYFIDTDTWQWNNVTTKSFAPSPRLDHSMVLVHLTATEEKDECPSHTDKQLGKAATSEAVQTCLLVFGGMDTAGQVFDDCFLFRVDTLHQTAGQEST